MSTPVPLRSDFDAAQRHKLARGSRDPDQTRRLLALAEVYAGGSRFGDRGGDSRKSGSWQADRDWVPDAMKADSLHYERSLPTCKCNRP
jgi:hypothetical protein